MIESMLGIIDKMQIEVYAKADCKGNPVASFIVQVNPDKYTVKQNVIYNDGQAMGSTGTDLKFNKIEGEEIGFDFLFDSTGILPEGKSFIGTKATTGGALSALSTLAPAVVNPFEKQKTVEEHVDLFKYHLMGYNSSTHQTAYLVLLWGSFTFNCRLKTMEIEYVQFARNGKPMRAKVKCVFKATTPFEKMLSEQNKNSPDMTHERTVTQSDSLALLSEDIYANNTYYTDVAKANKLLSFRKLTNGTKLIFPPLKS